MEQEDSAATEAPVKKKRGRKPGKRGRPKGSVTKIVKKKRGKRRGRPKGSTNSSPVSGGGRRRGRKPSASSGSNQQLSNGIHLIGELLVIDTNQLGCTEVIFVGGKTPKIR